MKKVIRYTIAFIFTVSSSLLFAQETPVILRAMQDELKRSITELQYENHERPFYIHYTIDDSKVFSVYSSLGALYGSRDVKSRTKDVRILVGDYEFNDESLDNNDPSEPSLHEIEMPLEDDYFGIRRSLWTTTDIVYKGAAEKYKKNKQTLAEKKKPLSEIPHRIFAKLEPHQTREAVTEYAIDRKKWEDYAKELSSYLKEIESLESSSVFFSFTRTVRYYVNSEGTTAIVPETIASFHCNAQVKSKYNTPINVQSVRYAKSLDELPAFAVLKKEVHDVVNKLKNIPDTKSLEEEYTGPVLFTGESVIPVFASVALSLNASNNLQGQDGYAGESGSSPENKLGKNYVDPSITIKALPGLKTFQGNPVIGNIVMDAEGVKPAAETVLIEKGVLKNVMNDRSLTKSDQVANGFSDGPGVIQASLENGMTMAALKKKLIAAAKAEGLDFALIVKGKSSPMGQPEIIKVNLTDGSEIQVSPGRIKNLQPKDLKRITGTSTLTMHYMPIGRGKVISTIVPEAVLIQEAEVTPFKNPYLKDDIEYITSPLKSLK